MLPWMKLEGKSDLADQNQAVRLEKLWWEEFGLFKAESQFMRVPPWGVSSSGLHEKDAEIEHHRLIYPPSRYSLLPLSTVDRLRKWRGSYYDKRLKASPFKKTCECGQSELQEQNCDLALKRNSQIFPIIISLSGQLGFEQPNHFFPNFIYGSIHRKAKSPPFLGGSPTF